MAKQIQNFSRNLKRKKKSGSPSKILIDMHELNLPECKNNYIKLEFSFMKYELY